MFASRTEQPPQAATEMKSLESLTDKELSERMEACIVISPNLTNEELEESRAELKVLSLEYTRRICSQLPND